MGIDTERRLEVYSQRGWCPVPWAHQPQAIKNELRRIGLRPQMKQCFANCQKFVMFSELDVEYREGWIISFIPMQHAWLMYEGQRVDLTLTPERGSSVEYLDSLAYSKFDIAHHAYGEGVWGIMDERRLHEISPWHELQEKLQQAQQGAA